MKELLTPDGEHHGIGDGKGWWWRRKKTPPPRSPKRTLDLLPMKNRRWRRLRLVVRDNSFSLIFSGKIGFYSVGFRVCGAIRWGQPTWTHLVRGARPGALCAPRCPPSVGLGSRISLLLYRNSSQSFVPFRELLFLHKNAMVVLLKTTLVRG